MGGAVRVMAQRCFRSRLSEQGVAAIVCGGPQSIPDAAHQARVSEPPTGSLPRQLPGSEHTPPSQGLLLVETVCFETCAGILGTVLQKNDLTG